MTNSESPDVPESGSTGARMVADSPIEPSPNGGSSYPSRRALRQAEIRQSIERGVPSVPTAVEAAVPASRPVNRVKRRSIRQQLTAGGTMTLVAGLFAALALPAYAGGDTVEAETLPVVRAVQGFAVSELATTADAGRDDYGATSGLEMRVQYMDAVRAANLRAYEASGARALGDDYPWVMEPHTGQGGGLSPLRYYYRECVDFVAWRLNRDAGSTGAPWRWDWSSLTPGGGNAISWKYQWDAKGWETGNTPHPGWVAWFGGANHVAYVSAVHDDGTITVEEYNWGTDHQYNQRRIAASSVASFLAPPS